MAQGNRTGGRAGKRRNKEALIADAIPYVRIARRRLQEYQEAGRWVTPGELHRVEHLLDHALAFCEKFIEASEVEDRYAQNR